MEYQYFEEARKIIRKRQQRLKNREDIFALIRRILLVTAVSLAVFYYFISVTRVSGNAMYPSVKDGDVVIGYMMQENFERDDIIVYETEEGQTRIGRILCAGNDVIHIDEDGFLYVNGTRQTGIVMDRNWFKSIDRFPYAIPANYVLVSADVLTDSSYEKTEDYTSYVRILNKEDIKSKIITIVRRRGF